MRISDWSSDVCSSDLPTLIIIDEGWLMLDSPAFAAQLREWLKTLRKKNASVIFATQSLADIESSSIAPAIIESCPTRILLPNERAAEPQIARVYERFGLKIGRALVCTQVPNAKHVCRLLLEKQNTSTETRNTHYESK